MPSPARSLDHPEARQLVAGRGFDRGPGAPHPGRHVGVELEWLAVCLDDPSRPAPFEAARAAAHNVDPLPGGGRVTFEPGGQVELSSPPLPLRLACDALARDASRLGEAMATLGVGLVASGLEPGHPRERAVRSARYDAMEAYFDAAGPSGRRMMRSTAATQINLDLGRGPEIDRRWRAAHAIGPMLAAAFANSPIGEHGPTGLRAARLAVWSDIDQCRTAAATPNGSDGRETWVDYALDAHVMLVRSSTDQHQAVLEPLTFAEWIDRGHELGWPTSEDLEYHLTTLFPPVRARGWIELRMVDAVPAPWWRVATAVASVLVQDPELETLVVEVALPTQDRWHQAARDALTDPLLGPAAIECFTAAHDVMKRSGTNLDAPDAITLESVAEYLDRYVRRGRCPADDRLDAWQARGAALPAPDNQPRRPRAEPRTEATWR